MAEVVEEAHLDDGALTGRPLLRSGLRLFVLGGLAVAVTFGIGQLIGAPPA